jgi:hypothetical protein
MSLVFTTYNLSTIDGLINDISSNSEVSSQLDTKPYNIKTCTFADVQYKVVRYNSDLVDDTNVETLGLVRSVIVNSEDTVVSFAPPKSLSITNFFEKYADSPQLYTEDVIEGTMINLFFDPVINRWEFSTKNTVGADTYFYHNVDKENMSFRTMFFQALDYLNIDLYYDIDTEYCYSFVLQHPKNKIVFNIENPQLYLVDVFSIQHKVAEGILQVKHIDPTILGGGLNRKVLHPQRYYLENFQTLVQSYQNGQVSPDRVGTFIKNYTTGERTKIENPNYEFLHTLRGNQPYLLYHYICLRQDDRVKMFLYYFPEYKHEITTYRKKIHTFTQNLYSLYIDCYIRKTIVTNNLEPAYKKHLYHLHQLYVTEWKVNGTTVSKPKVIEYVNTLHPSFLFSSLNAIV